ncbi:MAG: cytochrome-c peroxidase [Cypionkella sp.]|jgi:cytochrome c peroxidase
MQKVGILSVAAIVLLSGFSTKAADLNEWRRPLTIPFPADAPFDPRISGLGKMLFFDPRLSGAQNMSCATCHNPSFGWETPVAHAIGAASLPLPRSAPTTLDLAWNGPLLFWDGRAHSLEEQSGGPITAAKEMNSSFPQVIARLSKIAEYKHWFDTLFPGEGMTEATIKRSIATYERTIVAGWAPFDRWIEGNASAISPAAQRGFELFSGQAGCSACHTGWNFSSSEFDDIGLPGDDIGRAGITNDLNDAHKFKSPGLRNIALRAPYMHDGSLPTLEAVVHHYMSGGAMRPTQAPEIQPFSLTDEQVGDIVAFLNSLTEEETVIFTPILPAN